MATQAVRLDCYPYTAGSTILSADHAAIAKTMGVSEEQAVARLNPAGAIYFRMDEADVQRILQFDETMIGSDGLPHDAAPHPRLWGSFPRVLGHYGRTLGLFPLEKAVHKMTGLRAKNFGLKDRGVLREGAYADLTLFDADTVAEAATYEAPIANAHGIDTVIVNGAIVWRDGRSTGARPGRVLTH
jgi:N-acyl-D-amino-acid deacylase